MDGPLDGAGIEQGKEARARLLRSSLGHLGAFRGGLGRLKGLKVVESSLVRS